MQARRKLALFFRKAPRLLLIPYYLYRFFQPRYTIGVVGVIVNPKREILIVEHLFHPKHPWGLPGGWIGANEDPAETVIREVKEELGLSIQIGQFLLLDRTGYNHLDIAYLGYPIGDIGEISYELLNYKWLPAEQLPILRTFHMAAVQKALDILGL